MKGVTWNEQNQRWYARMQLDGVKYTLYSGDSEEKAKEARKAHNIKYGKKKCMDCDAMVTRSNNVLRCRPCAMAKRRKDIKKHNSKRYHRPYEIAFPAHTWTINRLHQWWPDKGNALADCFYEV